MSNEEIAGSEIRVTLKPTNVLTRWPCMVCNGHTEKDEVLAEFTDVNGDWHVVCERCLKAGVDHVRFRLEEKAKGLEAWATELRAYAKARWILPSHEEWLLANGYGTSPASITPTTNEVPW